MSFKSFLKLVEIQTKVASMIPFLLGTIYALFRFHVFNFKNFILMLISLLAIDMTTTAINNYYDYKRAIRTHGYGYESHNAIVKYKLKESTVIAAIFTLLGVAVISGLVLFLNTNIIVLLLGSLSFAIGILYSFGPIPISRTPFGEIFSGGFMGLIITFIGVYIHAYNERIITLSYSSGMLSLGVNIPEVIYIVLISIPTISGIANIMLANNICDIEDDIENKRYTLPVYIGKKKALIVFKALYIIAYIDILILILLRVAPIVTLLTLATWILINKHIKLFYEKQLKEETFILAVKNFVVLNLIYVITITVAVAIDYFI